MKRPFLSAEAQADLDDIWLYVAQDSVDAADRLVAALREKCRTLAVSPGMGRKRDELARGIRSFPAGNYVVLYLPRDGGIEVARVLSGFRDIDALFDA